LIHAKDTARDGSGDCPIGDGVEDWPAILGACRDVGVDWLIVEQEQSPDMLDDLTTSLRNVRRLAG
jgi:sugar phosphate isomerase/epimerase